MCNTKLTLRRYKTYVCMIHELAHASMETWSYIISRCAQESQHRRSRYHVVHQRNNLLQIYLLRFPDIGKDFPGPPEPAASSTHGRLRTANPPTLPQNPSLFGEGGRVRELKFGVSPRPRSLDPKWRCQRPFDAKILIN